jgi:hypothetical protein
VQHPPHGFRPHRGHVRFLGLLGLLVLVVSLQAASCSGDTGGVIPGPPATPTPCSLSCAPPVGPTTADKSLNTDTFTVYYDNPPWQVDQSNTNNTAVSLDLPTPYGGANAVFSGGSVLSGTTSGQLLASWVQGHIDPNKFTNFQDVGRINGAEIGYVPGAGESYAGFEDLPNAPNTPLYIQVVAAVKTKADNSANGIVFVVVTALDPSHPNPFSGRQVASGEYDRLLNKLVWL